MEALLKSEENQYPIGLSGTCYRLHLPVFIGGNSNLFQIKSGLTGANKPVFDDEKCHPGSPIITQKRLSKVKPVYLVHQKLCAIMVGELKWLTNIKPLRTAITHFRWRAIYWN
jgi:hypothetical protein